MTSFIKSIIIFIPFCTLIYIFLICVWGETVGGIWPSNLNSDIRLRSHVSLQLDELRFIPSVDIVVLGSSHAYRGLDPRVFHERGKSLYNLGSSNQTPLQTSMLMKRYVHRLNPKLVIYCVAPEMFITVGVESTVDFIANDNIDMETINMVARVKDIRALNALIFYSYKNWIQRRPKDNHIKLHHSDTYILGGFVETNRVKFKSRASNVNDDQFKKHQIECFHKTIEVIQKMDIPILLIRTPDLNYGRGADEQFTQLIRNTRQRFVDWNQIEDVMPVEYFYDDEHLTQEGVEIFNYDLIDFLEEINCID